MAHGQKTGANRANAASTDEVTIYDSAGVEVNFAPTGASARQVQGAAAVGADPAGNPVYVGGLVDTSPAVKTTAKFDALRLNARGALYVSILDASGVAMAMQSSFADAGAFVNSIPNKSHIAVWNGATWDRQRRLQNFTTVSAPATTNGAYSAGDVIGGKLTFASVVPASAENGEVSRAIVRFKTDQSSAAPRLDLVILNADPTNTSLSDNDAYALNAADYDKVIGVIPLTSYVDHGSVSSAEREYRIPFKLAGATLYGYLVARDAITLGSTSDVSVALTTASY